MSEGEEDKGRLFGIVHSSRKGADLWGKNQFNSTFPAAMACYMSAKKLKAVGLSVNGNRKVVADEISISDVFGTELATDDLFFDFEAKFDSYVAAVNDDVLERVDLVVGLKDEKDDGKVICGKQTRALEVKLTVVPDNTTASAPEKEWGPELVIRPATTKYCAMGMASTCDQAGVRKIFEDKLSKFANWGAQAEAKQILPIALDCLDEFEKAYRKKQMPLVLQPIWKTEGKSPVLAEQAFDLFVWTDFALARLIIDQARNSVGKDKIARPARSALRLARFLYEYGRAGKAHIGNIYNEMTYGYQSDKDFAVSGRVTAKYMDHKRRYKPSLPRSIVKSIILDGGEARLSPERRFDQSIYFSYEYETD